MQCCVVLEGSRLPHLYPRGAACHDPGTEDENLPYRLVEIIWELELSSLLSPLEYPEALRLAIARVAPGRKDPVLPCVCGGDICRSLGSRNEDEIQSALEIVCLKRSADGGGDLEGGFAQGDRCKRDTCWGN